MSAAVRPPATKAVAIVVAFAAAIACAPSAGVEARTGPGTEAAPGRASGRGDLRVVVISDLNSSYGSTEYEPEVVDAVRRIRDEWKPDLVLAAGDLIAGQRPTLPDEQVRAMWAAFDSVVGRPLRRAGIPFAFTLGNHDGSAYPAHWRDRELAIEHWRDPSRRPELEFVDSTNFPVYYSFTRGDAFFLVWDASFAGTAKDSAMMRWADSMLGSERAQAARFRFALGHLPLYGVAEGRDRPGEVLEQPDRLRALLERHRVHTYVSGHHHAFYPGRRGALELLHSGAVGQGARPLLGSDLPPRQTVTVLDLFVAEDSVAHTTYAYPTEGSGPPALLDPLSLPPLIRSHNGHVVRRDLPDTLARRD